MRTTHYRNYVVNRDAGRYWTYIGGQPQRWRTWDEATTAIDAAIAEMAKAIVDLDACGAGGPC